MEAKPITEEQRLERNRKARERRRYMKSLTEEQKAERAARWHATRRRNQASAEADIQRRAALWNQMLRIEAYLPTLRLKRQEAAERLAELDSLISDEERTVAEIKAAVR